ISMYLYVRSEALLDNLVDAGLMQSFSVESINAALGKIIWRRPLQVLTRDNAVLLEPSYI
ncbi:MAG: hypothetical protein AAGC93_10285, partial [Cyanobacteria bacterium P01_F01_bin.53]